ncbi:MAG TPA: hypothetical protein VFY84_11805 [Jiangellales bacterium]|nr:hypothetical protein [Jiangellales bacterium]
MRAVPVVALLRVRLTTPPAGSGGQRDCSASRPIAIAITLVVVAVVVAPGLFRDHLQQAVGSRIVVRATVTMIDQLHFKPYDGGFWHPALHDELQSSIAPSICSET